MNREGCKDMGDLSIYSECYGYEYTCMSKWYDDGTFQGCSTSSLIYL